jgi:hypothetical protein
MFGVYHLDDITKLWTKASSLSAVELSISIYRIISA